MRIDNQSAIAAAKEGGKEGRRKHIDIKHHVIVERVDNREIALRWIPSSENEADIFTKALNERAFVPLVKKVMGVK